VPAISFEEKTPQRVRDASNHPERSSEMDVSPLIADTDRRIRGYDRDANGSIDEDNRSSG